MKTNLTAILIADITGYTAYLASANRSDVNALISQQKRLLSPLIEARSGRIVKWMGDAVLATFRSASDAIFCGWSMQASMTQGAERGAGVIMPTLKIVVHAGDVQIGDDGDIYGDAVNLAARMEKIAQTSDVYFSEAVQLLVPRAEIPFESVGDYEFKGIAAPVKIYRTCFTASPVLRKRAVLVQTNFTSINKMADQHGWDTLHPILDEITAQIIEAARRNGGTNRGVMHNGCFLSFDDILGAFAAIKQWNEMATKIISSSVIEDGQLRVRTAVHHGVITLLKFTMMGRDLEITRSLVPLGNGDDILMTGPAHDLLTKMESSEDWKPVSHDELRSCRSRDSWIEKFGDIPVFAYKLK